MMRSRRLSVVLMLALGSTVWAETVQLPYQSPDNNGNQWIIYYQGSLQQQGNQPVFSQAGMVTINGQQPQQNQQTGSFDAATKELTVSFDSRGPVKHSRRFKFDEDSNVVRVIDIFENTQDREVPINVQLMTNTNFGVTDSQIVPDPKQKQNGGNIAWVANTGAERAALSMFAGKGSRLKPTIRYQQNSNQCFAAYPIKLASRQKSAIVSWYGTFDNGDAGVAWIDALKESKAVSDLPMELRKALLNVRGTGGGFIGDRELLRGNSNADIVELRGGDQMRGDIKLDAFALKTPYGLITLPAKSVAGLLNVGEYRPRQLIITHDGEIFGGELQQAAVPMQLASGQVTQVPLTQLSRLGYRSDLADAPEWKLDQPMVFLSGGERCRIEAPAEPIELVTRYGTLTLAGGQVSTILLGGTGAHEVYLSDGSRLSGVVSRTVWPLKLLASTSAEPVPITSAAIDRLQFAALAEGVGAGAPTIALSGTDIISARLEGQIKLVTTFDTLTLNAGEIAAIARPDPGLPDVQVTMFDQSTFRGTIEAATLPVQLTAGPKLDLAVAAIRDYQNPRPFPAQAIVTQTTQLIAQLNADDWKQREQVEVQLTTMGPNILSVLEEAAPKQPPEARERLQGIIKTLKKDQPPLTSRLTLPPPME